MSKALPPLFQAIKSPLIARQMAAVFYATNPNIAFFAPRYLQSIGIEDSHLTISQKFNGLRACHHASELLFYLLGKSSNLAPNLQFINFRHQTHCFLTSEDGKTIIDPTWKQFLSPDDLLRNVLLVYEDSKHPKECAKYFDFKGANKAILRDVELQIMSEDMVFVGDKKEMDEKFLYFVKSFNAAYQIENPDFDDAILEQIIPKSTFKYLINTQPYKHS